MEANRATIYVPAVVSLEVWFLSENRTVKLETGLREWWSKIESGHLVMVENTHEDVLSAFDLAWDHKDKFDRMIVQTALRLSVPLITADSAITEWGGVDVVW